MERFPGYTLVRTEDCPEQHGTLTVLTHDVSGATALLDIYLVLCILWGIIVITGGNLNVLNDTVMSSSLYYKIFNLFNPFL